jgi:hypothetical protein
LTAARSGRPSLSSSPLSPSPWPWYHSWILSTQRHLGTRSATRFETHTLNTSLAYELIASAGSFRRSSERMNDGCENSHHSPF